MSATTKTTIHLPAELAVPLIESAKARGWTPETLVVDCVAQHLETAIRQRVLIERLEKMDKYMTTVAEFIGEATADRGEIDLSKLCRFRQERSP